VNDQINKSLDNNQKGIDMVIGAKGSDLQIIFSSVYHIDNPTGNIKIDDTKAFLKEGHPLIKLSVPISIGDNYKGFRIIGTDEAILELYGASIATGKLFSDTGSVAIGHSVAKVTGLQIGDHFKSSHGLTSGDDLEHEHDLVVVGILKPSGTVLDNLILTSNYTVWDVHDNGAHDHSDHNHHDHEGHDHHTHNHTDLSREHLLTHTDKELTNVLIQFHNNKNFQALNLPNNIKKHTPMHAVAPAFAMSVFYDRMGIGFNLISWIAILISIISCISIGISLYNALRMRRYQLAILRVQGATKTDLLKMIVVEGLLIAILGFIVGVVLAYLGYIIAANLVETKFLYVWETFPMHIGVPIFAIISLVLGLVASITPALQAYKMDIHHALAE
jgi:putative ABC transport system permease protein